MRRRIVLAAALALVLSAALVAAPAALAQGKGNGGNGGGGGGGGGEKAADPPKKDPPKQEAPPKREDPPPPEEAPPAKNESEEDEPVEPAAAPAEPSRGKANESPKGADARGRDDASRERSRSDEKADPPGKDKDKERGRPDDAGKERGKSGEAHARRDARAAERAASGAASGALVTSAASEARENESNESESPAEAGEEAPRVAVERDGRPVSVAQGAVVVRAVGTDPDRPVRLVLVRPDGREDVIAHDGSSGTWNTTEYENGQYTVEVREQGEDGTTFTTASTKVLVENARTTPAAAVAAVATGAAVSAGAGALTARGFDLFSLARQSAGDLLGNVAEDRARERTAALGARRARLPAAAVLGVAAALLLLCRTFAESDSLATFAAALPVTGAAVVLLAVSTYGAEFALARASGATARLRLWAPGALSLVASSLLFRAPFGYPAFVDEDDSAGAAGRRRAESSHPRQGSGEDEPGGDDAPAQRRLAGRRALAFMGFALGITLPFVALGWLWRWEVAEAGVSLALMMAAAAVMPVSPMPGRDVWQWNRLAWLAAAAASVALHVLWQLAIVPAPAMVGVGLAGLAGFGMALAGLRHRVAGASGAPGA